VRIKNLDNVYETVCQSRYGVTTQRSEGRAKNVMGIHRRFVNTVLKTPTFAVNGVAGLEQGRHSRRDGALSLA
jgi:hypothetical protein